MSLVPRCPFCGGLEVVNGPLGRSMKSRCKCNDDEPNLLKGEDVPEDQLTVTQGDPLRRAA